MHARVCMHSKAGARRGQLDLVTLPFPAQLVESFGKLLSFFRAREQRARIASGCIAETPPAAHCPDRVKHAFARVATEAEELTESFKRVGLRKGAHQLVTQVTYGLAHGSKARAPEERCLLPLVPPVAAP
mgnify:CR=1 FL=1